MGSCSNLSNTSTQASKRTLLTATPYSGSSTNTQAPKHMAKDIRQQHPPAAPAPKLQSAHSHAHLAACNGTKCPNSKVTRPRTSRRDTSSKRHTIAHGHGAQGHGDLVAPAKSHQTGPKEPRHRHSLQSVTKGTKRLEWTQSTETQCL